MAKFAAKDSNKNITLSPHGTGKVVVGTGATDATVQSDGNHNLVLQTGNSTTGSISITDGADGNIAITPNGTGEVDISKVDIDGGTLGGFTIDGSWTATGQTCADLGTVTTADINGGTWQGTIDGSWTAAGQTCADLGTVTTADINGGTIDGTTIATSNITVGAGKTLNVSAGTLTLTDNQISGNAIDGGTISNFASTGIDDNASTTALTIDSSGNVGISGVSNGAKLDVNGSCAFGDGADVGGGHVAIKSDGNGTDGAFFIANTDGNKLMKVLDNGKTEIPGTIDSPGLVVQRNHAKYVSTQGLNVISEPNATSGVTTSNYIDSGLTTSITPKKTGNKIIVICSLIYGLNSNATALGLIRRTGPSVANSANIGTGGDARKASMVLYPFNTHSSSARFSASIVWEDEAQDTTTSHVYTFCGSHNGTGTAFYLNGTNVTYTGQSTITVLEVMV